ncbi:MAG TPA: hypothetical protein VK190_02740 [Pseudoneobacillus sp.]|nr:hypothetical protein [Pseudoneobacillus sp.]
MSTNLKTEMLLALFELDKAIDFANYQDSHESIHVFTRVSKISNPNKTSVIVVTLQWRAFSIVRFADNEHEDVVEAIRDLIDYAVNQWMAFSLEGEGVVAP